MDKEKKPRKTYVPSPRVQEIMRRMRSAERTGRLTLITPLTEAKRKSIWKLRPRARFSQPVEQSQSTDAGAAISSLAS
jgi:hypothetical protein